MRLKRGSASSAVGSAEGSRDTMVMYVLDETGSMEVVHDATVSGLNEYVGTLQKAPNAARCRFNLIAFNSDQGSARAIVGEPVASVGKFEKWEYVPSGATPLYDAIVDGIRDMETAVARQPADVVFVIHTDGFENASQRATRDAVFRLISEKRAAGWVFIFLGADQDAWNVASSIGVAAANSVSYDNTPSGTRKSFRSAGLATAHYMGSDAKSRVSLTSNLVSSSLGVADDEHVDLREGKK